MKKTNPSPLPQRLTNPYKNSDSNKRYYTYEYYCRKKYGTRCVKIPLDAGLTCPNIDGRCGDSGCIYCSPRGSGDSIPAGYSIDEQYRMGRAALSSKWSTAKTIPYFQAHTNTYAPREMLEPMFRAAVGYDGAVGLDIATRADCLPDDICAMLADLAELTDLTVELGLQSSNDDTAAFIGRGHDFKEFRKGYTRLRRTSDKITICIHIILGLPGEDDCMMLKTIADVAKLKPDMIKLHLLHVLRHTKLENMFARGEYTPLDREHYISLVVSSLELLPPDTVIARLTGDGISDDLIAPDWSRRKTTVINDIDKLMYSQNTYQGRLYAQ